MKPKILIIEDVTEIREGTAELLRLDGYDVATAENGTNGLALVSIFLPDLVICDIKMSGIDGYEVLAELKSNPLTAEISFLFCTAQSEKKDIRKAMDWGVDTYLIKPFSENELLSAVNACISKKRKWKYC